MSELREVNPFEFTLLEDASSPGKVVLEGVFQKANVKNQNNRIYPLSLWENTLKNQDVLAAINERRMVGEIEHPASGKTDLTRVSHLITGLWLEGEEVKGRLEVLSTPSGKILEALCRDGVKLGISSRASGSLKTTPNGAFVNESDFKLVTFDIVSNPSTPGAYPRVISEELDNENVPKENDMTAVEKYKLFEQRAAKILESKATDPSTKELVESAAVALIADIASAVKDSPELNELAKDLFEDLSAKRRDLKKVLTEATQGTIDTGIVRTMDQEAPPPPGEGWPFNPGDAGPLTGVTDHVNPWMGESEDEDEDDKNREKVEESNEDVMLAFAKKVVNLPESKETNALRALSAAYLLEHDTRKTEVSALERIIGRMQGLYEEATKSGKIVVENTNDRLEAKYKVALSMFEDLKNRYQTLSAKVYTEAALEKAGLKDNEQARNLMAEAIEKDPSKKNIDEALLALTSIKGLKPQGSKKIEESAEVIKEEAKVVESKAAKLTESTAKASSDYIVSRLSQNMHSRSYR